MKGDDGITRPTVRANVYGTDGNPYNELFLIDTGAVRTVFSTELLTKLQWVGNHAAPGFTLQGIGGSSPFVVGTTVVELTRDDGDPVKISGPFTAFTDPNAADLSILGRDVLDNFDVICSRRRREILIKRLAGGRKPCRIVPSALRRHRRRP